MKLTFERRELMSALSYLIQSNMHMLSLDLPKSVDAHIQEHIKTLSATSWEDVTRTLREAQDKGVTVGWSETHVTIEWHPEVFEDSLKIIPPKEMAKFLATTIHVIKLLDTVDTHAIYQNVGAFNAKWN